MHLRLQILSAGLLGTVILAFPLGCPPTDGDDDTSPTPTLAPTATQASPTPTPVPTPPNQLPLAVTDFYFLSGYFSEVKGADDWQVTYESKSPGACPQRAGDQRGDCMAVIYDRDPDQDGSGPNYSGWYWQYPENNWGQDNDGDGQPDLGEGWDMPQGATQVSFWAWGAVGGELVNFKAGIQSADGFERPSGPHTLTTTPTQYSIDLSGVSYEGVTGGFAWIMEWDLAPIGTTVAFYVDDITWE
jgi:hypothetical protein